MVKPNEEFKPPIAKIVVQPYEESRFFEEGESFEDRSILGADSTKTNKTYFRIRVLNYVGPVEIRMSCVGTQAPHRPHPYKLVGSSFCKDGVYTARTKIMEDNREWVFKDIVIQRVKKSAADESLALRKWMNVDPFRTGFDGVPSEFLSVRLGIEVLLPDAGGRFRMPVPALATDQLADRSPRLVVSYISHVSGSARGGTCIALFTEKLPRVELSVRFSEPSSGWAAEVRPRFIHKMCGMVVQAPPYRDPDTREPAQVTLELCRRPVGDEDIDGPRRSNAMSFAYEPEWRPAARRRRLSYDSQGSAAKHRRVDEKELDESLFGGSDDGSLTSGSSVEPMFREFGVRQGASVSPSEGTYRSESSQYRSSGRSSSNQSSWTGVHSPRMEQTPPMRQPDQTGQSWQQRHAPQMKQSPKVGQSPLMGQFFQTGPSSRMNQSPQVGQSPQMGPSLQQGQAPQMKQSPKVGQSPHMGQFFQTGLSSRMNQSPQVAQSPQMGPSLQTGQAPQMKQSPQAGLPLQTGQYPQMGQSPQMGQPLQTGQSPLMNQSYQMGQYLQHNSPIPCHIDGSPQFSPDLQTSPEMAQFLRMQQFSRDRELGQSFPTSPLYPTESNGNLAPASSHNPMLELQQQLLDQQRFEPVSGAEDIHSLLTMNPVSIPNDPNLHNLSNVLATMLFLQSTQESPESTGEL